MGDVDYIQHAAFNVNESQLVQWKILLSVGLVKF